MTRELVVVSPQGCSLLPSELDAQRGRAAALRGAVEGIDRRAGVLSIRFARSVDRASVDELVAVERECCSFFAIDYDRRGRVLRVETEDARRQPALDAFASFFVTGEAR
jgi:hypothetical protein